jgi:heme-degrading monooxygenase HmoA
LALQLLDTPFTYYINASKMSNNYYAVIFTTKQSTNLEGYSEMAEAMEALAAKQPGYIGVESASGELGITVSYWETLEAISQWKENIAHLRAQKKGKAQWYTWYKLRICKVEREYEFMK